MRSPAAALKSNYGSAMTCQVDSSDKLPASGRRSSGSSVISGAPAIDREYRYDTGGALVSIRDGRSGDEAFTYDALDRLVATARSQGIPESLAYDVTGNMRSMTEPGRGAVALEYSGDQLTASDNRKFVYDACGRLVRVIE